MKKWFLLMTLGLLAASACVKEPVPMEPRGEAKGHPAFTATTESAATKTALSGDDQTGYEIHWIAGDRIMVVDNASHVGEYSASLQSDPTGADFTIASGTEAGTSPYKAWYPASIYNNGAPTLPAKQDYVAGNISGSPMYAESSTNSLSFKNICGIIRLDVSASGSKRVRKIILSADQGMSGAISNAATLANDYTAAVSGTAGVTLDCGTGGVAISGTATSFHIAVPQKDYTNLKITLITTDGEIQTRISNKAIAVSRSAITPISLSFNNLTPTVNLSAKATANTYMVHSAGTYRFNATIKGNGGLDPLTGTTATPIDAPQIDGVAVLWELAARGKAIKYAGSSYDVFYSDGQVYFRTPETFVPGDAYVAVFKDGAGGTAGVYDKAYDEVLWSWLIWATEAPDATEYSGITILDRNVGAIGTGAGEYRGFCYEWGRKDPFPEAYNGTYTPVSFVPDRMTAFTLFDKGDGFTVAYSIAHPTHYPKGWTPYYWQTEDEFTTEMWWKNGKTIYDPCPIGWKVPSKDEMDIVINAANAGSITLPGVGFIGTTSTDFAYGNPGSRYYWTSTGDTRTNAYSIGDAPRPSCGQPIRPVEDVAARDITAYTDLSAAGTANCYIVPAAGDYKFPATVKGNGSASLASIDKNTDAASIAKAELLWASFGTSTIPAANTFIKKIFYKDGYVCFSTNETFAEGNAVVDIKNASGTILWSWHLWFTSADIEGLKKTYPGGAVFMDRNLGALRASFSADDTGEFGLLYQWGRKDPFNNVVRRGFGYVSSNNYLTAYQPAVQGQAETGGALAAAAYTVATIVTLPTYSYYGYYNSNIDYNSWTSNMTDNLWASDKTIFDPCPPGWKVPVKSDWDATFLSAFTTAAIRSESITQYSSTYTYQVGFDTNYGWFPSTGYHLTQKYWRQSGNNSYQESAGNGALEQNDGIHIRLWASDGILLRDYFSDTVGVLNYTDFVPNGRKTVYRTNANSVRCVKE